MVGISSPKHNNRQPFFSLETLVGRRAAEQLRKAKKNIAGPLKTSEVAITDTGLATHVPEKQKGKITPRDPKLLAELMGQRPVVQDARDLISQSSSNGGGFDLGNLLAETGDRRAEARPDTHGPDGRRAEARSPEPTPPPTSTPPTPTEPTTTTPAKNKPLISTKIKAGASGVISLGGAGYLFWTFINSTASLGTSLGSAALSHLLLPLSVLAGGIFLILSGANQLAKFIAARQAAGRLPARTSEPATTGDKSSTGDRDDAEITPDTPIITPAGGGITPPATGAQTLEELGASLSALAALEGDALAAAIERDIDHSPVKAALPYVLETNEAVKRNAATIITKLGGTYSSILLTTKFGKNYSLDNLRYAHATLAALENMPKATGGKRAAKTSILRFIKEASKPEHCDLTITAMSRTDTEATLPHRYYIKPSAKPIPGSIVINGDRFGGGSQGSLYHAVDSRTGRRVAAKVMSTGMYGSKDRDAAVFFRSEIVNYFAVYNSAPAELRPSFVEPLDYATYDDNPVLVMEYVPTKASAQEKRPWTIFSEGLPAILRLPIISRLDLIIQTAKAIAHMHSDNGHIPTCHRDLNPNNVFWRENSDGSMEAKVLDFGTAKREGDYDHTDPGKVPGHPSSMSPDYMAGVRTDADGRPVMPYYNDINYLGNLLYMAFSGQYQSYEVKDVFVWDPEKGSIDMSTGKEINFGGMSDAEKARHIWSGKLTGGLAVTTVAGNKTAQAKLTTVEYQGEEVPPAGVMAVAEKACFLQRNETSTNKGYATVDEFVADLERLRQLVASNAQYTILSEMPNLEETNPNHWWGANPNEAAPLIMEYVLEMRRLPKTAEGLRGWFTGACRNLVPDLETIATRNLDALAQLLLEQAESTGQQDLLKETLKDVDLGPLSLTAELRQELEKIQGGLS